MVEPLDDIDVAFSNAIADIPECKYHIALESIFEKICEKIESRYDWDLFSYWLGDESNFGYIYQHIFHVLLGDAFTEENKRLLEKKGWNLEVTISKWLSLWKQQHPNLPNEKMPLSCLRHKIYQYILYQLNKPDLRRLIGNPC